MHQATGSSCSASCRNPQDSQVELVPDSQDVGSEAAPEGESVADTSDWCSRSPQNRWNEEEKSNQKHDMCEAGEQDERNQQEAGEQKGVLRTPVTVTVRVTVSVEQSDSHDESKAGREREVEAQWQSGKVQGDGQHCTTGVGPSRCGSTE